MSEIKLSVNTGFAVNRITNYDEFLRFVNEKLMIKYIQPTSDWLNLYMPKKNSNEYVKKLNKALIKHKIKVNSVFTGAFTRLNHLAHSDKEYQKFWLDWFKNFINISSDLGSNYVGSHLGILSYTDNKDRDKILKKRVINNWLKLNEYSYKKNMPTLIWEPMSISREFGETISECKKIQKLLNKKNNKKINICLDVGHGDINSKNKNNFNPYKWLEAFASESPVIHLKQVKKNNFSHLPFTKKNNVSGLIEPLKILRIIEKKRTNSTELAFELSFKERDPIDSNMKNDIISSVKYWKSFLN